MTAFRVTPSWKISGWEQTRPWWQAIKERDNVSYRFKIVRYVNNITKRIYDRNWFYHNWIHKDTKTKYDEKWFDIDWFDRNWYSKDWYNKQWYNKDWYDRDWFDRLWYDKSWYNARWFNKEGIHKSQDGRLSEMWWVLMHLFRWKWLP